MDAGYKTLTPMEAPLALVSSFMYSKFPASAGLSSFASPASPIAAVLLRLVRRSLILTLRLVLLLLYPVLLYCSRVGGGGPRRRQPSFPSSAGPTVPASSPAERALSHVLSVLSRVPVASRKYELVRSLADRLLDDNVGFASASFLNAGALSSAFQQTIRGLELAVTPPAESGPVDVVMSAVMKWGKVACGEVAASASGGGFEAEKMAAEAMWLAGKMAECGGVEMAVARWGEAAGLAKAALAAEPKIQVAFVRVSAFLFKHANAKQFGRKLNGGEEYHGEGEECLASRYRMSMLTSWLPLLCRASNGADTPVFAGRERAEMAKVLEEMIEKLSWEQQEEVLALWLHHFASCPDSDWPNLEACYTRWYSKSRADLLEHSL